MPGKVWLRDDSITAVHNRIWAASRAELYAALDRALVKRFVRALPRYHAAYGEAVPMSSKTPAAAPAATAAGPAPGPRPGPPAALSAFLRGVERRGAVLAELQAGDAAAGDAALAAAMAQFRPIAAQAALGEWPSRFWSLLLTQPGLRHRTPVAIALEATDRLAELGSGPRAALLLRLAAGLDENEAAAALGVAAPSYRLALQRALPRHADGRADPLAWQQLREQVHRRIKTLPPERLQRLSQARETALAGEAAATAAGGRRVAAAAAPDRPRWLMPLLWSGLGACALAFAATFWSDGPAGRWLAGADRIEIEPLPAASAPAERYQRESGLIAHRDFELIADPAGEAAAADLAFHSWLAALDAGRIAPAEPPSDRAAGDPPSAPAAPATGSETQDLESADAP